LLWRICAPNGPEHDDESGGTDEEHVHPGAELEAARQDESDHRQRQGGCEEEPDGVKDVAPHAGAPAGMCPSSDPRTAAVDPRRSSSRTCSSATIASSFIAGSISWCENFAWV